MTNSLNCVQVGALLPFYIENKLSEHLHQFVSSHLETCPKCKTKYERLKKMLLDLKNEHEIKSENKIKSNNELSDELMLSLSAYVDNELDEFESLKVKKNIISNPKAREEIDNIYTLKNVMQKNFEKELAEFKSDFSKQILKKTNFKDEVYCEDGFFKVFIILLACSSSLLFLTIYLVLH